MKKILILGASGFLGGVLFRSFVERGIYEVHGSYCRTKTDPRYFFLDVFDRDTVSDCFQRLKPDAVIWCLMDMEKEHLLTGYGLKNVIDCLPANCRFVYLSTNVFNDGVGNNREDRPPHYTDDGHPACRYVLAKIEAEKQVRKLPDHLIIRPGILYGQDVNGNWDRRISNMIRALSSGHEIYLSSKKLATWAEVRHLSNVIANAMDRDFSGILHAGSDRCESGYSINRKIAVKLGLNTELIRQAEEEFDTVDNTYNLDLLASQHFPGK